MHNKNRNLYKIIKRTLSFVLIAAMAIAILAACENSSEPTETSTEAIAETTAVDGSAFNGGTLPDDANVAPVDKELIVATVAPYPPFSFADDADYEGMDKEIADAIAEYLKLTTSFKYADFNSLLDDVRSGKYDIGIAAIPADVHASEGLIFSPPYADGSLSALVTASSEMSSEDDMAKANIGFIEGRSAEQYCEKKFSKAKPKAFSKIEDALKALEPGDIDCFVLDEATAAAYAETNDSLKKIDLSDSDFSYVICVEKENSELLTAINEALYVLQEKGTIKKIFEKYNFK